MASFNEETARKILAQVEFYFSDSNLPRDKFLHKTVIQSKDGLVSLPLLCSFSRMRNYLGLGKVKREDIPEGVLEGVAEILQKSRFLKVSADGKRVGRITELSRPEEVLEQIDRRTIGVSPFEYDVNIEAVESLFSQYFKVNSVRLPHHIGDKRCFCGTALVEFSTEEDAQQVLKLNLVYAGAVLSLTPKKEFDSERGKMIKEFEKSCSYTGPSHNDSPNISCRKGLLVAFTLKRISSQEKHKKQKNKNKGSGNKGSAEKSKETTIRENEEKVSEDAIYQPIDESSGDICQESEEKMSGSHESTIPPKKEDEVTSCEDLKDVFQRFGTVKYVDYTPKSDSGYICFQEAETAVKARAAMGFVGAGGLAVKKSFLAFLEAVDGEAERQFWKRFPGDRLECQKSINSEGCADLPHLSEKENTIEMEKA